MIFPVVIFTFAFLAHLAGLGVAFSPTRRILAYSLVGLSVSMGLLSFLLVDASMGFWLTAAFFLADFAIIYVLFSTDLRPEKPEAIGAKQRALQGFVLSLIGFVTITAIFGAATLSVNRLEPNAEAPILYQATLWVDYWPVTLLCSLVGVPLMIGAILLVRLRR